MKRWPFPFSFPFGKEKKGKLEPETDSRLSLTPFVPEPILPSPVSQKGSGSQPEVNPGPAAVPAGSERIGQKVKRIKLTWKNKPRSSASPPAGPSSSSLGGISGGSSLGSDDRPRLTARPPGFENVKRIKLTWKNQPVHRNEPSNDGLLVPKDELSDAGLVVPKEEPSDDGFVNIKNEPCNDGF